MPKTETERYNSLSIRKQLAICCEKVATLRHDHKIVTSRPVKVTDRDGNVVEKVIYRGGSGIDHCAACLWMHRKDLATKKLMKIARRRERMLQAQKSRTLAS